LLGLVLLAQTLSIFYAVTKTEHKSVEDTTTGLTQSIGRAMYTEYLLPVEIVGVLLLMAIVGAMMMSRKLSQPNLRLVKKED
jgi:NADH-quinone oxidoreductase subunit J